MKENLAEMSCLDIYLSNITNEEYNTIKHTITSIKPKSVPLLSSDIFMEDYHKRMVQAKKELEMNHVLSFAQKFNWKNDLNLTFSENDYEAIIITDIHQNIIWVNDGFTSMTGYSKNYALNKTPRFLQGEQTSAKVKNRIKEKIRLNKPFQELIINHKKDHTTYKCEVKIFPLYNQKTTHFMALERQVV